MTNPDKPLESLGSLESPESPDLVRWVEINREYTKKWPNITKKKDALPEAKEMDGVKNKFEKFFDPRPAKLSK